VIKNEKKHHFFTKFILQILLGFLKNDQKLMILGDLAPLQPIIGFEKNDQKNQKIIIF